MEEKTLNVIDLTMNTLENWYEVMVKMLPNFVLAIVIIILFAIIGRIITRSVKRMLKRLTHKEVIINLMGTILYVLILFAGIMIALRVMSLNGTVKSFLAGLGILGLALGFALKDITTNFISGIILAIRSPFEVGDRIVVDGSEGEVKEINLRDTEIISPQGEYIVIPNKIVMENAIKNRYYTGKRRLELSYRVHYEEDLRQIQQLALNALEDIPNRLKEREIKVHFYEFGDSSIEFTAQVWIEYHSNQDLWLSRSEAIIAVKEAFDTVNISIPIPVGVELEHVPIGNSTLDKPQQ